jgi:hypothetical protein
MPSSTSLPFPLARMGIKNCIAFGRSFVYVTHKYPYNGLFSELLGPQGAAEP